jgi:hypothetical protein
MADAGAIQRGSELGISELERDSFIQRQSSIRDSSQIDGDYMDMEDAASSGRASELQMSAPAIMRTFTLMCVSFSVNHACITTASGYAAADFPTSGNASNSALYSAYCVSAMFFGGAIITAVGAKKGLIGGLFLYTIYISTFFVANIADESFLIIVGAAIGGMGAGFLWVCQGSYYTECSKLYASATGKDLPTVTGELGSHFATIFLSLELVFKLLAGFIKLGIPGKTGSLVVYIFFFIACVCSVFGMIACTDLRSAEERQPKAVTADMITGKAIAAANLMVSDIRMPLMIPTQLAFAFVASFLGAYVTPVSKNSLVAAPPYAYVRCFVPGHHPKGLRSRRQRVHCILPRPDCISSRPRIIRRRQIHQCDRFAMAYDGNGGWCVLLRGRPLPHLHRGIHLHRGVEGDLDLHSDGRGPRYLREYEQGRHRRLLP